MMLSTCPLVDRYFGDYLRQLLQAQRNSNFIGSFVNYASNPYGLEERLRRIEHLGLTEAVLAEIGEYNDPNKLDDRLLDLWAELRTIDQLNLEGFSQIRKITEIADFTTVLHGQQYAFQVTRIDTLLHERLQKKNLDASPVGTLESIKTRFKESTLLVFLRAINEKNRRFADWQERDFVRCIVLVNIDQGLQDGLIRHFACQEICKRMCELRTRNFEEILWLPDLGNGAWFQIDTDGGAKCFADWQDNPADPRFGQASVIRWEIDLESNIDSWKSQNNLR